MKRLLFSIICFSALVRSAMAAPATLPNADDLLKSWRNAIYTDREHSKMTLSLIDPKAGTLTRKAEIWYKSKSPGDSRILMRFSSPADIRGVSFLSLASGEGADQWLYLPAYKKARRLSSHGREESFLDSDFSNGDISFAYQNAFDFKTTGQKTVDGLDVYVVEGRVKDAHKNELPYSKQILYIGKGDRLARRAEFFGRKDEVVKTLVMSNWKKYGARWACDKLVVENSKTGHRSVLEVFDRKTDADPADRLFTLSELESGR